MGVHAAWSRTRGLTRDVQRRVDFKMVSLVYLSLFSMAPDRAALWLAVKAATHKFSFLLIFLFSYLLLT